MVIIDDLLLMPVKGLWGIVERINEMIEQELNDKESLQKKLLELQLRYEMDEISEEEYQEKEANILSRLEALENDS